MILTKYIFDTYENLIKEASESQLEELDKEVKSLVQWGERWADEIADPPYRTGYVLKVVKIDDKVCEIPFEQIVWPLEEANKKMLGNVDDRVIESFKKVKKMKFERPSIVIYGRLFFYLHSKEIGDVYADKLKKWAGVQLVLRRIESTTRVALRFDDPDKYGPKHVYRENGEVSLEYGSAPWRKELVQRRILSDKRGG